MAEPKPALFKLPEKPTDRHVVVFYGLLYGSIFEYRFVFHRNTPMRAVVPEYVRTDGPPFVNQWAMYKDNRIEGRVDGWDLLTHVSKWQGRFFSTKLAALRQLKADLVRNVQTREEQLAESKNDLAEAERLLAEAEAKEADRG